MTNSDEGDGMTERVIAWDRDESDMCQKLTPGCAIDHFAEAEVARPESDCDTW